MYISEVKINAKVSARDVAVIPQFAQWGYYRLFQALVQSGNGNENKKIEMQRAYNLWKTRGKIANLSLFGVRVTFLQSICNLSCQNHLSTRCISLCFAQNRNLKIKLSSFPSKRIITYLGVLRYIPI